MARSGQLQQTGKQFWSTEEPARMLFRAALNETVGASLLDNVRGHA
jgi:hypothetical protein